MGLQLIVSVPAYDDARPIGADGMPRSPSLGACQEVDLHVVIETRAPGLLSSITEEHPGLVVDAYPAGSHLLLRCTSADRVLPPDDAWAAEGRDVLWTQRVGGELTVLMTSGRDPEVLGYLLADGVHVIPPVRWSGGRARLAMRVPAAVDLEAILGLFPGAALVSKTRAGPGNGAGGVDGPRLAAVTEKQARALVRAYEDGYYERPRRVTTGELARREGVARSTFEHHLTRAEASVVTGAIPLIRLRADPGPRVDADALETFSRYSRELDLMLVMRLRGERVRELTLQEPDTGSGQERDHPYLERILEHLRTGSADLSDVPVDIEATAFHRDVLEALREVPAGETVTYGELAKALGRPGAARAVGRACATNPALVVIPCHRVVPAAGGLGNYSGGRGAATKRRLLELEGALGGEDS